LLCQRKLPGHYLAVNGVGNGQSLFGLSYKSEIFEVPYIVVVGFIGAIVGLVTCKDAPNYARNAGFGEFVAEVVEVGIAA
jgi:hypothetical protein